MDKTADTARYFQNETREYVGRVDKQVKIRGHSIKIKT